MDTFHIHIRGLVQGVGFRPFVHQLADEMNLYGYISNTKNGVHIEINANEDTASVFYHKIIQHPPQNALITGHLISKTTFKSYNQFSITTDTSDEVPDLFLTPDIALCENCRHDLSDDQGKRYHYPFTTCLQCGPRYSISTKLPYDRINTTMSHLKMCHDCLHEYEDIGDSRYYSQTNSCPTCAIQMHIYDNPLSSIHLSQEAILTFTSNALLSGKIVSVKGTGGFLLICDATQKHVIDKLRLRKHRPTKPFAVMYSDITMAEQDVFINEVEKRILISKAAPILLCHKKNISHSGLSSHEIAPGLDKIGVMLPNNPLLHLISKACNIPLVTTSGNVSGSPILYKDEDALTHLFDIADYVLTYDREIVMPQDDSVLQITETGQHIILRRSRGLAPGYFPNPFPNNDESLLSFGADLKGVFAMLQKDNIYVSQFLGDQQSLESQKAYNQTMSQLTGMLCIKPSVLLCDSHPGYYSSLAASTYAEKHHVHHLIKIQHHNAHFGAVLAENSLLNTFDPILGIIWDGTGYGDDEQIWGSEIFIYENYCIRRLAHLRYFNHLMNDKMSREPRLSALSLLKDMTAHQHMIESYFNATEWKYYHKVLSGKPHTKTCSMGRFMDGIACILGIGSFQTYEGEIVMKMEALARQHEPEKETYYDFDIVNGDIDYSSFLSACIDDFVKTGNIPKICRKVLYSLAKLVEVLADHFGAEKIAFSGGVFQNALLVDMIKTLLDGKKHLYFHQQLSPNDECIGFGQIACYHIQQQYDKNQTLVEYSVR